MRQRWKPIHASGRHCCSSTFSIFVQRTCPCHYTETSVKSSEAPCISFFLKVLLAQTWMCNFWFMPSSLYYSVDDTWRAPVIKPTITCQALTPIYDWVAVAVIFEVRGEGEAYVIGGRQPLRNEILQTCCPRELSESILACCKAHASSSPPPLLDLWGLPLAPKRGPQQAECRPQRRFKTCPNDPAGERVPRLVSGSCWQSVCCCCTLFLLLDEITDAR